MIRLLVFRNNKGFARHSSFRFASGTSRLQLTEKIAVQLLKDFPRIGTKGEIVRVRPAFMRNYLHLNNGACYITKEQGPRIPVVEKVKAKEPEKPKIEEVQPEPEKAPTVTPQAHAMSLDELTSLFKNMKSNSRKSNAEKNDSDHSLFAAASEGSYTTAELRQLIPNINKISFKNAGDATISKKYISSLLFDISGIQIATADIRLLNSADENISEISEAGEFVMLLNVPDEKANVRKTIIVE